MGIPKAGVWGWGGRQRSQLDTCNLSWEVRTIPESAFHLGLGQMHTCPMQQLQPFSAAATLVAANTGAGFAGSVAGLTFSHLWVTVEARATVPHATAAYMRTQNGGMKRNPGWLSLVLYAGPSSKQAEGRLRNIF